MNSRSGTFLVLKKTAAALQIYSNGKTIVDAFWIPRSVITHRSTIRVAGKWEHEQVRLIVEGWWLAKPEKKHLDKYFS